MGAGGTTATEWPPRIALENITVGTREMTVDADAVAEKVRLLEKSTTRGCYVGTSANASTGKIEWRKFRIQWGIAYGLLTTRVDLHGRQGQPGLAGFQPANGYGPQAESPASLSFKDFKILLIGSRELCQ